MKNLVKGYDLLLGSELHDYLMEYLSINSEGVEFVAKAEDYTETLKLQFENIKKIGVQGEIGAIFGDGSETGFRVVSIIDGIEMEKLDDNTLKTIIGTSYGIDVYIISDKLTVTRI